MKNFDLRWSIRWYMMIAVIVAVLALTFLFSVRGHRAPTVPTYPNALGEYHIPSAIEAQILGESFGGFTTRDSIADVRKYYDTILQQHGWRDRWYRNPAGICYTLLIIENDPVQARIAPDETSVAFKLRQAFYSELNTTAPPGCK